MRTDLSSFSTIAPAMPPARNGEHAWTAVTTPSTGKPSSFEGLLRRVGQERATSKVANEAAVTPQQKSIAKAHKAFEAVTLQVLVGSMMPSENNKSFGTGSAGKIWKSLFAEKLAEQFAASGRIKLLPDAAFAAAAQSGKGLAQQAKPSAEHNFKLAVAGVSQPWATTVVASPVPVAEDSIGSDVATKKLGD
jgi:Rod binding domain-containing protein